MTQTTDVSEIAAEVAQDIETADSVKDAGLRGPNVLGVDYTVGLNGALKEISVAFNAHNARITVELYTGALTASAGFDSHRTHINDDAEAVLDEAARFWEMQAPDSIEA